MTNREWAMKMIPVLIHWAKYSWETPHYYSDLSKVVGHKTNRIGGILGEIHDIISDYSKLNGCVIPSLNSLIINKSTGLPNDGFKYVISNYDQLGNNEKLSIAEEFRKKAHNYDWDWVLNGLGLEPYNPPVNYWILPSNNEKFRIHDYLLKHDIVDWKQNRNFSEGDIIFLYCSSPQSRIRYMFRAIRTELKSTDYYNDKEYWTDESEFILGQKQNRFVRLKLLGRLDEDDDRLSLKVLKELGVTQFQGGAQIKSMKCINYILDIFGVTNDLDTDLLNTTDKTFFEGVKKQVTVNTYERDQNARNLCIKLHGTTCTVCGVNFEKTYGEIGKGFIHVHHIVPIHSIGKEYKLNPEKDLIPVCPNCHAMLHRGLNGEARSVEELKNLLNK